MLFFYAVFSVLKLVIFSAKLRIMKTRLVSGRFPWGFPDCCPAFAEEMRGVLPTNAAGFRARRASCFHPDLAGSGEEVVVVVVVVVSLSITTTTSFSLSFSLFIYSGLFLLLFASTFLLDSFLSGSCTVPCNDFRGCFSPFFPRFSLFFTVFSLFFDRFPSFFVDFSSFFAENPLFFPDFRCFSSVFHRKIWLLFFIYNKL